MTLDHRRALLHSPADPVPAQARFVEARFSSPEGEWAPAIDGAVLATLDNGVLAAPAAPEHGRFPLPATLDTRAVLERWGVTVDTPVIVYAVDPDDAKSAARAWFVLRGAGVRDVRVLDGGATAWHARQGAARGDAAPRENAPRDEASQDVDPQVEVADGAAAVPDVRPIDADQAAAIGASGLLLDARPAAAYAAGHIPGAVSAPGGEVFRGGRLLPHDELRAWAGDLPTGSPVAAYCGGGVAAAGTVFALAALGVDADLYVGSWSQWSADPSRPVEVG